ncbi:putative cyanate hydratase [Violaceomyces palustris]|uniref:Cyanate hydratase n=1 Tax=Violaceomyces palustris TaxID=1673888 RepID=A0ACD0NNW1_9BASI|nr:putative cyanate hydratase [Violaceomyces palustris]
MSSTTHKPTILSNLPPIFSMLHEAKTKAGLTFEQLAQKIGRDEWYVAAIFYGQAKPDKQDIERLSQSLDVRINYLDEGLGDNFFPHRGLGEFPPQDPVLYRLYEVLVVYGYPLKHMIHEKFGDGIMSAIDFEGHVDKIEDPKGDRE